VLGAPTLAVLNPVDPAEAAPATDATPDPEAAPAGAAVPMEE
jgi:hypothetical protein